MNGLGNYVTSMLQLTGHQLGDSPFTSVISLDKLVFFDPITNKYVTLQGKSLLACRRFAAGLLEKGNSLSEKVVDREHFSIYAAFVLGHDQFRDETISRLLLASVDIAVDLIDDSFKRELFLRLVSGFYTSKANRIVATLDSMERYVFLNTVEYKSESLILKECRSFERSRFAPFGRIPAAQLYRDVLEGVVTLPSDICFGNRKRVGRKVGVLLDLYDKGLKERNSLYKDIFRMELRFDGLLYGREPVTATLFGASGVMDVLKLAPLLRRSVNDIADFKVRKRSRGRPYFGNVHKWSVDPWWSSVLDRVYDETSPSYTLFLDGWLRDALAETLKGSTGAEIRQPTALTTTAKGCY